MASQPQEMTAKRAEQVARAIEDRIVALGWPVGRLIGSEQSLMEEHDASRGVLREAVRLLEHHGTARMRRGPGGGLVVQAPSASAVRRSAALLLHYRRTDLAALVAARKAMELTCLDLVADRMPEDPMIGGRLLSSLQAEAIHPGYRGSEFHLTLARQCGNPVISMLAETLIELHGEALPRHGEPIDPEHALLDQATCRDDHSVILDALTANSRAAARRAHRTSRPPRRCQPGHRRRPEPARLTLSLSLKPGSR